MAVAVAVESIQVELVVLAVLAVVEKVATLTDKMVLLVQQTLVVVVVGHLRVLLAVLAVRVL